MIGRCPRCQQIYACDDSNTDFVHECNSGIETLDNEDVVNIASAGANFQGLQDNSGGAGVGIPNKDLEKLTSRGNRASTHTTRQHSEYIDLTNRK